MSIQRPYKLQRAASLGYSLLELMIVAAVIAVLAAVAVSSYSKYVVNTNRAAATACMSEYASYMERFYTTNMSYAEIPASGSTAAEPNPVISAVGTQSPMVLDCASTAQTGNNYEYSVPAPTATTYTIDAVPINSQLTRDTQCGTLTLNQAGQRYANGGSNTSTILTQCWGG
jgi:type IV pilus assembly protein PilE